MSYNEQETRFFRIDPVLRDKGYNDHQWITPQQIIGSIEQQGRIVSEALGRLATLLETGEAR